METPPPSVRLLTHDEYVDSRNQQDEQLRHEFSVIHDKFSAVHDEFSAVHDEFSTVRAEIGCVREDLTSEIGKLRAEFKEDLTSEIGKLRAESKEETQSIREETRSIREETRSIRENFTNLTQSVMSLRNSLVKNPIQRISTIPRWDYKQNKQIEPEHFPKNAKEFYGLRNHTSARQREMLLYLAGFYDIKVVINSSSGEESDEEQDLLINTEQVIERLGGILGLEETNFIRFIEKAKRFATQSSMARTKRDRLDEISSWPTQRRKLDIDTLETFHDLSPKLEGEHSHLLWGSRSTPSSQRPTINHLKSRSRARPRSHSQPLSEPLKSRSPSSLHSGSPTNPYSTPLVFRGGAESRSGTGRRTAS